MKSVCEGKCPWKKRIKLRMVLVLSCLVLQDDILCKYCQEFNVFFKVLYLTTLSADGI